MLNVKCFQLSPLVATSQYFRLGPQLQATTFSYEQNFRLGQKPQARVSSGWVRDLTREGVEPNPGPGQPKGSDLLRSGTIPAFRKVDEDNEHALARVAGSNPGNKIASPYEQNGSSSGILPKSNGGVRRLAQPGW